jgi:hypothetical protein
LIIRLQAANEIATLTEPILSKVNFRECHAINFCKNLTCRYK